MLAGSLYAPFTSRMVGCRDPRRSRSSGVPNSAFELQMLFGIRAADQVRLARAGYAMRVLISYGSYWFPWYMRRLAERPANIWFVVKSMFA